jgi:glycosyltransferase involved in cell wall biosynthesis
MRHLSRSANLSSRTDGLGRFFFRRDTGLSRCGAKYVSAENGPPAQILRGMKVCFLAGTLTPGGAERQLYYMLQALCQAGAVPRVLSLDRGGFWEEKIKALGVPVTCVGDARPRWQRLLGVLREARRNPPAVLQSQHFYTNAYAGMAARLLRVSGIGAMRSNGASEVRRSGFFGGWLNLRLPAVIAANSQQAIQYAVAQGIPARRLHFLPNVVDTERFKPSRTSESPPDGEQAGERKCRPLKLIAVGRFGREKRLDRFISIVHRLRTDFELNVKGMIVGSGRLDQDVGPALEDQAQRLGLWPDVIEFRGDVSDMPPVYREATVCVLTSDYEGTPNVLLEAMACGLPVIATRVGGVPDIVRHGHCGLLHDPDDLDGLTASLVAMAKNPGLRIEMGRRARAYVEQNHSPQILPGHLAGLYRLAVRGRCDSPF